MFAWLFTSVSQAQSPTWSTLQTHAATLNLADDPQWHALLHYIPSRLGGVHSTVDAPWFFNAVDGKINPLAELNSTIQALVENKIVAVKGEPASCTFIARYRWLQQKLAFDSQQIPEPSCPRFETWRARLQPRGVTLIFPSAYINSPSSMFGHTLLRLDTEHQTEQTSLLAYAVNFGADTGRDGGALFALKGLTGMYPGRFSVAPYYELVKKYSALENRDIWEYTLDLTATEIQRLVEHLWELRGVYFDYFFFDENCSYHLLALLDVARPHTQLAYNFPAWAIPADTVRAVAARGMITQTRFRPAQRTVLQHRIDALPPETYPIIHHLADARDATPLADSVAQLPTQHAAESLTTAYDYLHYQLLADQVPRDIAAPRLQSLLAMRSALPASHPINNMPHTPRTRPDQGHDTARISLALGTISGHDTLALRLQPAFHELLDPEEGYVNGAQINFLDWRAHYDLEDETWRTERVSLIDIASITPRDDFFHPWSWTVRAGWQRVTLPKQDRYNAEEMTLAFQLHAGGGVAQRTTDTMRIYGLGTATLEFDAAYNRGYALAPGIDLGLIWKPHVQLALQARMQYHSYIATADFERTRLSLEARYPLAVAQVLGVDLSQDRTTGTRRNMALLTWTAFF